MIGYESAPRYRELVERLTGQQQDLVPPGLELESDRAEWLFIGRTTLGAGSFGVTSAAGTRSEALLYNPPAVKDFPGVLVTVLRFRYTVNVAVVVNYRLLRAAAPPAGFVDVNTGPLDTRDARIVASRATAARVLQAANAAADGGIAFDNLTAPATTIVDERDPIVLAPGTGLILEVSVNGVNTLLGGFRWRERGTTAEELAT